MTAEALRKCDQYTRLLGPTILDEEVSVGEADGAHGGIRDALLAEAVFPREDVPLGERDDHLVCAVFGVDYPVHREGRPSKLLARFVGVRQLDH